MPTRAVPTRPCLDRAAFLNRLGGPVRVVPGGPFALACAELVKSGFTVRYVELWSDEQARETKYICPACGLGAWGKPAINIVCGSCNERMEGEETNTEGASGS